MAKIACNSSSIRCCWTFSSALATVAIKSLIIVPVYITQPQKMDSYHGTRKAALSFFFPPQRIFVRVEPEILTPARHYSCAGNPGRFSGAKLFPPPAFLRCEPADCDRSLLQLLLPASSSAPCSTCPRSRPCGRHPLRCDPPTSEN